MGQIEEKDGKFVAAANEFEIAAHMDPSEENLFAWGSEMLLHRTYEPAIAIFQEGAKRYPNSPRILIGLGLSLYSRGKYDEAVKALLAAADLTPADPRCFLFLSKAYNSSPLQADGVTERFRRVDFGHMQFQITYSDPETLTKPLSISLAVNYAADTDMLENVCNESDRKVVHMVGTANKGVQLSPAVLAKYA